MICLDIETIKAGFGLPSAWKSDAAIICIPISGINIDTIRIAVVPNDINSESLLKTLIIELGKIWIIKNPTVE